MTGAATPGEVRPRRVEAIAFDLYGTLLAIDEPLLQREVPRLFGVSGRRWLELVRRRLLTTAFADTRGLSEFVCRSLTGQAAGPLADACAAAVERELASVRVVEGVPPLLHFLKLRGLKLGLISNVSSAHKAPFVALGLADFFDAVVFSCDAGRTKPDPGLYLELCRRLGVEPEAVLMVGDSLANDVRAPAQLGMMTARIDPHATGPGLRTAAELAWLSLAGPGPASAMLERGRLLAVGAGAVRVTGLRPVSQGVQGRYNLVYEVEAESVAEHEPRTRVLYAKRYMSPESAHVEALAYRIQGCAGLPTCGAWALEGPEPWLLVTKAPGARFGGELDPALARELGRHFAFGFVFSNADLRPRNAFVARAGDGSATVTMVDLEHCFFNLAIDVASVLDPTDPDALDRLGEEAVRRLTRKRVLTERTLPRARAEFFDARTAAPDAVRAYRDGFLAQYRDLKARADWICDLIGRRIRERPRLIIGTRGYRRAMAGLDLDDIRSRLAADPGPILEQLLAVRT